jgi:uncharacterized protein (UPF0335 family)
MVRTGVTLLLLTWLIAATGLAAGTDQWLAEFNESCARTSEAMNLSREELLALIAKCERVQKAVETQDDAVRKVYQKRVQKCLDLFRYVLDTKAADVKVPSAAK